MSPGAAAQLLPYAPGGSTLLSALALFSMWTALGRTMSYISDLGRSRERARGVTVLGMDLSEWCH